MAGFAVLTAPLAAQTDAVQVVSFSPSSVPPGGELTIKGTGFSVEPGRTHIIIKAGALSTPVLPLEATTDTLRVFIVPLVVGTQREWYQGPAQICVQVGDVETCAGDLLTIEPPATPTLPAGETLLKMANEVATSVSASIEDPGLRHTLYTDSQTHIANLRAMITEALAGQPRTMSFTNIDGTPGTASFDVSLLQTIESLLVAYQHSTAVSANPQQQMSFSRTAGATGSDCRSSDEKALMMANARHRDLVRAQAILAYASLVAAVVAVAAVCISSGPACLVTATPTAQLILGTLGPTFTLTSWPIFIQQLSLEYSPNNLAEIYPTDTAFNLSIFTSRQFNVIGRFVPLSTNTQFKTIVTKLYTDVLFALLPTDSIKLPLVYDLLVHLGEELATSALDLWKDTYVPILAGDVSRLVTLGSDSLSLVPIDPISFSSDLSITLACGDSAVSTIFGHQPAVDGELINFRFGVGNDTFLLLTPARPPSALFQVTLLDDITTVDLAITPRTVVGGKDILGTVSISRTLIGDIKIRVLTDSSLVSVPDAVIIPAGQSSVQFTIKTSPVTTAQQVYISAAYASIRYYQPIVLTPPKATAPSAAVQRDTSTSVLVSSGGDALSLSTYFEGKRLQEE